MPIPVQSQQSALEVFRYAAHICHSVEDETHYLGGERQPTQTYEQLDELSHTIVLGPNLLRNFGQLTDCLYCSTRMEVEKDNYFYHGSRADRRIEKVGFRCLSCGWWYVQVQDTIDDDEGDFISDHLTTREGIICRFEPEPWKVALLHASEELSTYKKSLASVTPHDMERLVGQILGQHYNCEVHHVGRSGDRGIDLLLVKSDKTVAVQVKHRRIRKGAESVAALRDFVGALVGEGFREGVFVTTAEHFSPHAERYASRVARVFAPIDLVTVRRLRELIGNLVTEQWKEYYRAGTMWK